MKKPEAGSSEGVAPDTHAKTFRFSELLERERRVLDEIAGDALGGRGDSADEEVRAHITDQRRALDESERALEEGNVAPMAKYLLASAASFIENHFAPAGGEDEAFAARAKREGARRVVAAKFEQVSALLAEEIEATPEE